MNASPRTTIVSAADAGYARSLCQLLRSLARHAPDCDIAVFDLGMTPAQRRAAGRMFPRAAFVDFDFAAAPPHVRALHTCGWKPAAIERVAEQRRGIVLWLDAACIVHQRLEPVSAAIARDGILSLAGQSPAERWCHPATFAAMHCPPEDRVKRCRAGGVLGFDASRADVRSLVTQWREYAFEPWCIDPPGASRANHRYDQAILTNLLHRAEREGWLVLQEDAIDISAVDPVRWVSTRNTVARWIPVAADPLVRAWYRVAKSIDRVALRVKARSRAASYPPASVRTARR